MKRKKKLIPPYERTPDDKPFQVYEILEKPAKKRQEYRPNRFVSPIFGQNVKDEVVVPIKTSQRRDMDKLDPFRTKPQLTKEERVRKYGTAYPEFDLVKGKDLDEVMASRTSASTPKKTMTAKIMPGQPSDALRPAESAAASHQAADETPEKTPHQEKRDEPDFKAEADKAAAESSDQSAPKDEATIREDERPSLETPRPHAGPDESERPEASPHAMHGGSEHEAYPTSEDTQTSQEAAFDPPRTQDAETSGDGPQRTKSAAEKMIKAGEKTYEDYQIPPIDLLDRSIEDPPDLSESIEKQTNILNETFEEFGIGARVYAHIQGPTVTRYEIAVEKGVKLNKITAINDNIKMKLGAEHIRIQAPIPGKKTVGIEVPNEEPETVHFLNVVDRSMFKQAAMPLTVALGIDIDGTPIYAPIKSMPHGLIAGQTGSGKSVCIHTILMSLLLKYKPSDLRLMLIDPKMVELSIYNELPHLITPVISDEKAATAGLKWVMEEMERRFNMFKALRVRDIDGYNEKIEDYSERMPYIVIVVDELSDLMMVASQHVEEAIMRITQKARACGIHLLIATQRPSTDVIKGTIKSNIPTRIAFSVSSHIDSQTILDATGAETLLGKGDMLYMTAGHHKTRLQGAFISEKDIETVTEFIRNQAPPQYVFSENALVENATKSFEQDELLPDVARFVVDRQEASINKISKTFSIGFNRAQNIVESLESAGIVSGNLGSKAREVLVDADELESLLRTL